MGDIAGLTFGIISLAGLFSNCVDAFAYVKAGQALERALQVLLVKLDIEKARLVSWGNAVGIIRGVNDGRNSVLNDPTTEDTIRSILVSVRLLLTDSQELRRKYAVEEIPESSQTIAAAATTQRLDLVSHSSLSAFKRSYNRLRTRVGAAHDRSQVGMLRRVAWAVHDRERFGDLITDLRELIDGLERLVPDVRSAIERAMEDDVASLRLSSLRLVEEALGEEHRYQVLSDAVSEAIQATELGTIDRWLDDQSETEAVQPEAGPATAPAMAQVQRSLYLDPHQRCFMMFTTQCESARTNNLPCIDPGPERTEPWPAHFAWKSMLIRQAKSWHPARRIASWIDLDGVSGLDPDTVRQLRVALQRRSLGNVAGTESDASQTFTDDYPPYIAEINIYCPPCTWLVDTAVDLCNNMPDPLLIRRLIRIDDRLPCSCLDRAVALEALQLILRQIHQVEGRHGLSDSYLRSSRAEYVDRDFLEGRILALEGEQSPPLPPTPEENVQRIFDAHGFNDRECGVVILGEHQSLANLAQVPAFPRVPQMTRENEIYVFCRHSTWHRNRIGTFLTQQNIPQRAQEP